MSASRGDDRLVVLMAGGLGRRLGTLTLDRPKPLLHVGEKPILETLLERLVGQGFTRFRIAVHYKAHMIEEHFGDGSSWGVEISYLREETPLGTAGALCLVPDVVTAPVLVVNGDLVTTTDFRDLVAAHAASGAAATMAVRPYDVHVPFGVVERSGTRLRRIVEKPVYGLWVNAGMYVLDPACIDLVPRGCAYDMTELFDDVLARGMHAEAFAVDGSWRDVGRLGDLLEANDSAVASSSLFDPRND